MRILIADDEPLARERLRHLLEQMDSIDTLEQEAANGKQAIELADSLQPDLILMDIRMPGLDGLQAANHIATLQTPPAVIFCTAYEEHALEAFRAQAVGYLLKPVKKVALAEAIQNARRLTRSQLNALQQQTNSLQDNNHISARSHRGIELIPVNDIFFFQADSKYVTVHHRQGEILIDESLKELQEKLGDRFVRIHRNALVARDSIESMTRNQQGQYQLHLKNSHASLQVSRRHVSGIRKLMQKL